MVETRSYIPSQEEARANLDRVYVPKAQPFGEIPSLNQGEQNPTRSLGETAKDTGISFARGVGSIGDALASTVENKPVSSIDNWLSNYQSSKLNLEQAQDQRAAAEQAATDEKNNASALTRLGHGIENFAREPLVNTAKGLGTMAPMVIPGAGGIAALGATGAMQANKEAMEKGDTGLQRLADIGAGTLENVAPMGIGKLHGLIGSVGGGKLAKLGADAVGGSAVMGAGEAVKGNDPYEAAGEGIAPGVGFGAGHLAMSGLKPTAKAIGIKAGELGGKAVDTFNDKFRSDEAPVAGTSEETEPQEEDEVQPDDIKVPEETQTTDVPKDVKPDFNAFKEFIDKQELSPEQKEMINNNTAKRMEPASIDTAAKLEDENPNHEGIVRANEAIANQHDVVDQVHKDIMNSGDVPETVKAVAQHALNNRAIERQSARNQRQAIQDHFDNNPELENSLSDEGRESLKDAYGDGSNDVMFHRKAPATSITEDAINKAIQQTGDKTLHDSVKKSFNTGYLGTKKNGDEFGIPALKRSVGDFNNAVSRGDRTTASHILNHMIGVVKSKDAKYRAVQSGDKNHTESGVIPRVDGHWLYSQRRKNHIVPTMAEGHTEATPTFKKNLFIENHAYANAVEALAKEHGINIKTSLPRIGKEALAQETPKPNTREAIKAKRQQPNVDSRQGDLFAHTDQQEVSQPIEEPSQEQEEEVVNNRPLDQEPSLLQKEEEDENYKESEQNEDSNLHNNLKEYDVTQSHEPIDVAYAIHTTKDVQVNDKSIKSLAQFMQRTMFKAQDYINDLIEEKFPTDESLQYSNGRDNAVVKLLDQDGILPTHIFESVHASVFNGLFNLKNRRNPPVNETEWNPQTISSQTLITKSVEDSLKVLGWEIPDDVAYYPIRRALASIASTVIKHMEDEGYTSRVELKNGGSAISLNKPLAKAMSLPDDFIVNSALNKVGKVIKDFSMGEKLDSPPIKHISDKQNEAVKRENEKAYHIAPHWAKFLVNMGSSYGEMFVPKEHGHYAPYKKIREAKIAARQNASDWLQNIVNHPEYEEGMPLFFRNLVSSNGRIRQGTNSPQSSKTLRVGVTPFKKTVTLDDPHWNRAFAQALGAKIERMTDEEVSDFVTEKKAEFLEHLHLIDGTNPTALTELFRDKGLDEHGLMALVEYKQLHDHGTIESHLPIYADGICNGVSTSIIQRLLPIHGRSVVSFARAGYRFITGNESFDRSLSQQSKSMGDIYTEVADTMRPLSNPVIKQVFQNAGYVKEDGSWNRNIVKQPLQMSSYMASVKGIGLQLKDIYQAEVMSQKDQGLLPLDYDEHLDDKYFITIAEDLHNNMEKVFPSEVMDRLIAINHATQVLAEHGNKLSNKFREGKKLSDVTGGEIKHVKDLQIQNAPMIHMDDIHMPYLKDHADIADSKRLVQGLAKGSPSWYYQPREQVTDGMGGGIASVIAAADVHPMVSNINQGHMEHATQIFDGVGSQDGHVMSQNLNKAYVEGTQRNPYEPWINQIESKGIKFKDLDKLKLYSKQWEASNKVMNKYARSIEQFSVGEGSDHIMEGKYLPPDVNQIASILKREINAELAKKEPKPTVSNEPDVTVKAHTLARTRTSNNKTDMALKKILLKNPRLKETDVFVTSDPDKLIQEGNKYVSEFGFDPTTDYGCYIPSANKILVLRKSGESIGQTVLHEMTHAALDGHINNLDPSSEQYKQIETLMTHVTQSTELNELDDGKNLTYAVQQLDGKQAMKEFFAHFLSSRALIDKATNMKAPFVTKVLSIVKQWLGSLGFLRKQSLTKSVFLHAGSLVHMPDSTGTDMVNNSVMKMSRWFGKNTEQTDLMNNLKVMENFASAVPMADSELSALNNSGWDLDPAEQTLFRSYRTVIDTHPVQSVKFIRQAAGYTSKLLDQHGADYLGTTPAKNLLALSLLRPNEFQYKPDMPWLFSKTAREVGQEYATTINAMDKSNITLDKLLNHYNDIQSAVSGKVQDLIGEGTDVMSKKLIGTTSGDVVDHLAEGLSSFTNSSRIPEAARPIFTALTAVADKEVPLLGSIRAMKFQLDKMRQNARGKTPASLKKQFKLGVSKIESEALMKLIQSDIGKYHDWKELRHSEPEISVPKQAKEHADRLAQYMADGRVTNNLHRNAKIIAKRFGGDELALDKYIGHKAYSLMDEKHKEAIGHLLDHQEKAVDTMVGFANHLRETNSMGANDAELFNATKGYIPNAFKDDQFHVVAATKDSKEYKHLRSLGYTDTGAYTPNGKETLKGDLRIMTTMEQGNIGSNQGGLSRIAHSVMGYNTGSKHINDFSIGDTKIEGEPSDRGSALHPVFNSDGEPIKYQRCFKLANKLRYKKVNDVFKSLGSYEGNLVEMHLRDKMNALQISKLHDMYMKDPNKGEYINVLDSKDPVIKQAIDAMPKSFKRMVQRQFGQSEFMPVPRRLVEDLIGGKQASIGDFWTGNTRWSPKTQEMVQKVAAGILGEKAYPLLVGAERILKEVTNVAARNIAVASIKIPFRNMCNDILQLMSSGIPLSHIATRGAEIGKELRAYNKATQAISDLNVQVHGEMKDSLRAVYMKKIDVQKQLIRGLSIHPLIESGLYSAVDNDIIANSDADGLISQYMNPVLDKLPPAMTKLGGELFSARDSKLFRATQAAVETTDFIARALTYEKAMKDGMTHENSVQKAANQFVDYGRAKGRVRGYSESIGMAWFWNTKLRSLAIASTLLRDNPLLSVLYNQVPVDTHIGFINNMVTPLTDNILFHAANGQLGYSLGFGQLGSSWKLNPFMEIMN